MSLQVSESCKPVSPSTESTVFLDALDGKEPSGELYNIESPMPIRKRESVTLSPNFTSKKSKMKDLPEKRKGSASRDTERQRTDSGYSSEDGCSSSDCEDEEDYRVGGYHRVHVNEIFADKYKAVRKLGWGHFSTVWLVESIDKSSPVAYGAMKVQKSSKNYTEAAESEIELLSFIQSKSSPKNYNLHVVKLLSSFFHVGPNGRHLCMVFERLGNNLLSVIRAYKYKGIPFTLVKQLAYQILASFQFLHETCGIIHTDLKPENVLVAGMRGSTASILRKKLSALTLPVKPKKYRSIKLKDVKSSVEDFKELNFEEKQVEQVSIGEVYNFEIRLISNSADIGKLRSLSDGCQIVETSVDPTPELSEISRLLEVILGSNPVLETLVAKKPLLQFCMKFKAIRIHDLLSVLETIEEADMSGFRYTMFNFHGSCIVLPIPETSGVKLASLYQRLNIPMPEVLEIGQQLQHIDGNVYDLSVKTVDLGNSCFRNKHFQEEIQTREYRAPEAIIVADFDTPADIWSIGCMLYELATGEMLFKPQKANGHGKDEDHIALILELLIRKDKGVERHVMRSRSRRDRSRAACLFGARQFAMSGSCSGKFFDKSGRMRHIKERRLKFQDLSSILKLEHGIEGPECDKFVDLLLRMLRILPGDREKASKLLEHEWFKNMHFVG